jgi:heterodisulfide reductase subunit A2
MTDTTPKKTALLLCKCGTNIADFVDLDEIARWAKEIPDLVVVESHGLLCSPDGKQFVSETLERVKPERVVIAACSPKMHEKTFQAVAEGSGMNMADVQMANIREHCAWVTKDKKQATEKAKRLIAAQIGRARLAEELQHRSMKVIPDLLVIGGGIAGIEVALTAARAGRKVTIVDREISLGGAVIKTEEVAPNMECAPCLLAPLLSAVRENGDITVVTNAEVAEVKGFYGNFTAKILKKARFVEDSCIGCEACFEVCPVETPSPFHLNMGKRKAVATLFPGSVPAAAVIDKNVCLHFRDGSCEACKPACPFGSINFDQKDETVEVKVGAVVVATGFDGPEKATLAKYGYGTIENVYTIDEFERLASSNGPTGGAIKMKNGAVPKSVAVIHCAGSLSPDGIPWCSGTCCMLAAKVGELVRKTLPETKVTNIHRDLVFGGPDQFAFHEKSAEEGTKWVRCEDLASVKVKGAGGRIMVSGKGITAVEADMVVLATGMRPASGTAGLGRLLAAETNRSGYLKPDHQLTHETGASLDGMYLAGAAAGPCDVPTAVTRAQACAGDALAKLVPGREIELEAMTTFIDPDKCAGCKLCISSCPYKAISFKTDKKISEVNEAICRGCGTCTATCPSGAASSRHFTDKQIYAEIGGLLHG